MTKHNCKHCGAPFEGESRARFCSVACQFDSKYVKAENGCWEWKAAKINTGYGLMRVGNIAKLAHRLSYERRHGSADGLFVCHRCDNPGCVNPDHLFVGTQTDNMRDMSRKGRAGFQGRSRSEEDRLKIAEGLRRNPRPNTDRQRAAAGKAMKTLWATAEFREKMIGRTPHNKGKPMSQETRAKFAAYWASMRKSA